MLWGKGYLLPLSSCGIVRAFHEWNHVILGRVIIEYYLWEFGDDEL